MGVPLSDAVDRLLRAASSFQVDMLSCAELTRALDLLESASWLRVILTIDNVELGTLSEDSSGADEERLGFSRRASRVLALAGAIAEHYDDPAVFPGHVAMAVVLTSDLPGDRRMGLAVLASEEFGLGTPDRLSEFESGWALRARQAAGTDPIGKAEVSTATVGEDALFRRSMFQMLFVRLCVAAVIVADAVRTGHLWGLVFVVVALVIGWPVTRNWMLLPLAFVAGFGGLEASAWSLAALVGLLAFVQDRTMKADASNTVYVAADGVEIPLRLRGLAAGLARHDWKTDSRRFRCRSVLLVALWVWLPAFAHSTMSGLLVFTMAMVLAGRQPWLAARIAAAALCGAAALLLHEELVIVGIALIGALVVLGVQWLLDRPPLPPLPFPSVPKIRRVTPRGRRLVRIDRLLRTDHVDLALSLASEGGPTGESPEILLRRAAGLLESGDPAAARETAKAIRMNPEHSAPGDFAACLEALAAIELRDFLGLDELLTGIVARPPHRNFAALRAEIAYARATVLLARDDPERAGEILDGIVPVLLQGNEDVRLVRALRLRALCLTNTHPAFGAALLKDALRIVTQLADLNKYDEDLIFRRSRALGTEAALCRLDQAMLALSSGHVSEDLANALGLEGGVAEWLLKVGRPLDAARALTLQARCFERLASEAEALTSCVQALSLLDATRYQTRHQADRVAWAIQHGQVLESALAAAFRRSEWNLLAELIEAARLQGLPEGVAANAGDSDDAGELPPPSVIPHDATVDVARRAARPSAGLLPVSPAPFIRIRGRSLLESMSLHAEEQQPAGLDIETVAVMAAGDEAWWWGSWSTPTMLYWSIVPPAGEVHGGRMFLGDGTDLGVLLSRLLETLPIRLAGEDKNAVERRMESSPLEWGPLALERRLSEDLSRLLPQPLVAELRSRTSSNPVPLAIAPATAFANVPWPVVAIPGTDNARLIERAGPILAPSAAMLDFICRRADSQESDAPIRLAVINPTSDLPETERLVADLPDDATILTHEGQAGGPSLERLSAELQAIPQRSTVLFACHTANRGATPSSGGLLLRCSSDGSEVVLSSELLLQETTRFPIPCQALVMACDSGDVGGTTGGEWFTLGPSLLWAGADRTVVTTYPVYDFPLVDERLIRMLATGFPVRDALHHIQRDLLASWRVAGDDPDVEALPPILWAGHVALGAFGRTQPPDQTRLARLTIGTSAMALLNDAAEIAGQESVNAVHLATASLLWGEGEELPLIRLAPGIWSVFPAMTVQRAARWMLRQSGRRQSIPITAPALSILAGSGLVARRAGSSQIRAEHIVYSLITNATGTAQLLIRLIPGAKGERFKRHLLVSDRDAERDYDPSRPPRHLTPEQLTAFTNAATAQEASIPATVRGRPRR